MNTFFRAICSSLLVLLTLCAQAQSPGAVGVLTKVASASGTTFDPLAFTYGAAVPTFSNGNRTVSCVDVAGNNSGARSTTSHTTGLYYAEITIGAGSSPSSPAVHGNIGLCNSSYTGTTALGATANGWAYYSYNGGGGLSFKYAGGVTGAYGTPYIIGDVISIKYNGTGGIVSFAKNGTIQTTDPPFTGLTGAMYISVSSIQDPCTTVFTLNSGASAWDSRTSTLRTSLSGSGYLTWNGGVL
jgi:hypothetical protein